ncbi:putative Cell division control protein 42 like protein [Blattamonas nauphoetae]|uniref:Cell division control protein 42 like protein n=1 Tax=Blattamonas nauphoetae TaxID=2049346 RepID=A0ABQ9X5K6_9EUKA|nr:putative Cell division control protein 42 like protein [Blattamonas nauphoetae]
MSRSGAQSGNSIVTVCSYLCLPHSLLLPFFSIIAFLPTRNSFHFQEAKVSVIGDGAVGKTCLILSYTQNSFSDTSVSTVFDNYESLQVVDGKKVKLQLWDTAGQEDYDRLRSLSFSETDVFLLLFSIINEQSFKNIESRYFPDICTYTHDTPVVLVGTKSDYRANPPDGTTLVSKEQAEELVERLKLYKYVECSAKTKENLSDVFDTVAKAALERALTKRRSGRGSDDDGNSNCEVM